MNPSGAKDHRSLKVLEEVSWKYRKQWQETKSEVDRKWTPVNS